MADGSLALALALANTGPLAAFEVLYEHAIQFIKNMQDFYACLKPQYEAIIHELYAINKEILHYANTMIVITIT